MAMKDDQLKEVTMWNVLYSTKVKLIDQSTVKYCQAIDHSG
jgi:hypothetical protein